MKKPKRPKAPKRSASLARWEDYKKRLNDWKKKCAKIDADKKKKAKLIDSLRRA